MVFKSVDCFGICEEYVYFKVELEVVYVYICSVDGCEIVINDYDFLMYEVFLIRIYFNVFKK